jgi:hypothetical protein
VGGLGQQLQPVAHVHAILTAQGSHIGNRCERHQIELTVRQ